MKWPISNQLSEYCISLRSCIIVKTVTYPCWWYHPSLWAGCCSELTTSWAPFCMMTSSKWKHFPHYWPFVRGIHRSPVSSPHKSQWRGALMYSLICTWINGWVNNREAGDLRRYRAHYDVTGMRPFYLYNRSSYTDKITSFIVKQTSLLPRPQQKRINGWLWRMIHIGCL